MLTGILGTIGFSLLVLLVVYRRVRRNLGRQKYRHKRIVARLVLLGLVGVGLLLVPWTSFPVKVAALVAGVALAVYGLHLTKFENGRNGSFYTPNTYVGLAVISLFLGRLVYRIAAIVTMARSDAPATAFAFDPGSMQSLHRTSLTLAIVFLLVAYYVCYYTGVLIRCRDLETA